MLMTRKCGLCNVLFDKLDITFPIVSGEVQFNVCKTCFKEELND